MRKVIAAINMTPDGNCNHANVIADDALHQHFSDLMMETDISIMGRKTYLMMENYWPNVALEKSGSPSEIQFAERFDEIEKIVISSSLQEVNWKNARILRNSVIEEVKRLKKKDGGYISIGSPSLILYLTKAGLIDEFNFVIHPFIVGEGPLLFSEIQDKIKLNLIGSEIFDSGVISAHYKADYEV